MSTSSKSVAIAALAGVALGIPVLILASALIDGWVLSIMWGWFMVPMFGLPSITIPAAIGLALVASFLTHQYVNNKGEGNTVGAMVGHVLLRPFFTLFFAWIVQLFV